MGKNERIVGHDGLLLISKKFVMKSETRKFFLSTGHRKLRSEQQDFGEIHEISNH